MIPKILNLYWNEYERKQQEEADINDYTAWLNGQYIMLAIATAVNKKNKYPEECFHLLNEKERWKEENPTKAAAIDFGNYAAAFNIARGGEASRSTN